MLTAIKSILRLVKNPWLIAGAITLIGVMYVGYNHIQNLKQTIADREYTIEANNKAHDEYITQLNSKINELVKINESCKANLDETNAELTRVRSEISRIERERRIAEDKLIKAMGRQELVWQKPKLVESFLRRNWKNSVDELSCVTGALEKCKEE